VECSRSMHDVRTYVVRALNTVLGKGRSGGRSVTKGSREF
jgi:hypothetical protein